MFENVGHKVKLLAKIMFWLGTILFWYFGLKLFFEGAKHDFGVSFLTLILVAGGGTLIMYLANLMTLAFGELVEHTTRNMQINEKIYEKLNSKKTDQYPSNGYNSYMDALKAKQMLQQQAQAQPSQVQQAQPQPSQAQQVQPQQAPQPSPVQNPNRWFCTSCGSIVRHSRYRL